MKIILLLFFAATLAKARFIDEKCEVSMDYSSTGDLKEPQPLVLTDSERPDFLLPNDKKLLTIPTNASIVLSCPGKNNYFENLTSTTDRKQQSIKAICLRGKTFQVNSSAHEFSEFKCKSPVENRVKKTNSTCLDKHQLYEIGFSLGSHFLKIMDICRDESSYTTYYTKFTLAKEILGHQSGYPRAYWRYRPYYNPYNMNEIYKMTSQVRSFEVQLGSAELAQKYVRPGEQYLNRGHLTAKADMIYGSQQSATHWILNTGAQWSSVNSGNWLRIEYAVRNYAIERRRDVVVYTGVHGQGELPDVEGRSQPLFLHASGQERVLPVPRFFWKVLHDVEAGNAIAFVTLNDPYPANVTRDMYICEDIADEEMHAWLKWQPVNITSGLSYLCSVQDLRKAVPTVPALGQDVGLIKFG